MIPKIATFCWSGERPMSWLRRQSMESFRRLNPDWRVNLVDTTGRDPCGDGFRFDILRSDLARYEELFEIGGFYFDTDIVFVRPIPARWLSSHLALPLCKNTRRVTHIASLGCTPGHSFFHYLISRCKQAIESQDVLGYQDLGINILSKLAIPDDVFPIDTDAMLSHPWDQVASMWSSAMKKDISPDAIGIHWFGGDRLSEEMEKRFSESGSPDCIVARALSMSVPCNSM